MTIQKINYGLAPDDGTGDKLRDAFVKADNNFTDLDTRKANGEDVVDALAFKADATYVSTELAKKANLASPALTGTPTAPTAATATNTTQLATTAFVQAVNAADTGSAATAVALKTARTINGVSFNGTANITINAVDATSRIASSEKGAANGVATLDSSGKVPAVQLPSYVDDVLEFANLSAFPATGEAGKIYVALDTNKTYRWSGSAYVYITSGAVDSVAGKTGVVTLVKADVGLSNVDNTADSAKPISTAQQLALDSKETPAGALAQMRSFGLGASYLTYITDADGHRVSGKFALSAADSAAAGLPFSGIHIISYSPGNSNSNGEMWATAVSSSAVNGGRVWFRKLNNNVWQPWKELAFVDSANTWTAPQTFRDTGNLPIQILSASGDLCGYIKPALTSGGIGLRTVGSSPTTTVLDIDGENGKALQIRIGRATNVGTNVAQFIGYAHDSSGVVNFLIDFKTGDLRAKGVFDTTSTGAPNVYVDSAGNLRRSSSNSTIYEEGSWTPILFGVTAAGSPTYTTNAGRYVRTGNLCYVSGRVAITNKGGASGSLRLSGLPFIVKAGTVEANAAISFGYTTGLTLPADALSISAFAVTGANRIEFYLMRTGTLGSRSLLDTDIGNGFTIYFSGVYEV